MTYTPTIYDWRVDVAPLNQIVRAGGAALDGGMTIGGASVFSPEPGGRLELALDFAPFATEAANRNASWTVSRIMNGAVMRIRLWPTIQLVPEADLTVPDAGVPWSEDQPWANDANWAADPWVPVTMSGLRGTTTVVADMSSLGQVLGIGHVIGFTSGAYDFAHVVMDIDYDGADVATITVSPPLRRDIVPADGETEADRLRFRPAMLAVCINAQEVMANFQRGRHMALNSARFIEALV